MPHGLEYRKAPMGRIGELGKLSPDTLAEHSTATATACGPSAGLAWFTRPARSTKPLLPIELLGVRSG